MAAGGIVLVFATNQWCETIQLGVADNELAPGALLGPGMHKQLMSVIAWPGYPRVVRQGRATRCLPLVPVA